MLFSPRQCATACNADQPATDGSQRKPIGLPWILEPIKPFLIWTE
jgi:hypothetical protein